MFVFRRLILSRFATAFLFVLPIAFVGCGEPDAPDAATEGAGEGERQFVSIGTAPVGGTFYQIGGAIADVLNDQPNLNWRAVAESTGGSMENIRRLDAGDLQAAISNASITYFAVRGEEGWEKAYPVEASMTLFPNIALFIARADSGIETIADLKGKRVAVGPEGAGFEYFVRPILAAHGVTFDDFEDVYAGQQQCVDLLGDGAIDAAFLGGGIPTASITSAAASMDIHFVPFGEAEKRQLIEQYPFFHPATIPANTYRGQSEAFEGLNVGSAHIIVPADADEAFVYELTSAIFEGREAIAEKHRAGRGINAENAVTNTGIDFHPGAIRYYEEIGIWPGSDADEAGAEAGAGSAAQEETGIDGETGATDESAAAPPATSPPAETSY